MAWSSKVAPASDALPAWARGRISPYAFEELKRCRPPYGYVGRRDTMRRLADKGLVSQIESGAYVVTENGIDLIEGRYRHPVDAPDATVPPLKRYPATPRQSSLEPVGTGVIMKGRKRVDLYLPRAVNAARSQEAVGMVQAVRSAVAPYTVEPTTDGCDVIRPRFGSAIRRGKS